MFAAKQVFQRALTAPRNAMMLRSVAANCARMNAMSVRGFSNTAVVSSGASKLSKALEKEIKYENENYQQLEDIETFLQESGFAYTEEENGLVMTLKKTVGDKTIEVVFEARYVLIHRRKSNLQFVNSDKLLTLQNLVTRFCYLSFTRGSDFHFCVL